MVASKHTAELPKNAAAGKKFAIVASRYHREIVDQLVEGAQETLESHGAKKADVSVIWVPGSFEIPVVARAVLDHQEPDAVICLGVIIKGETMHNEYIAHEVARGISQLSNQVGKPVIFGVLTPEDADQAKARAGGNKGHKGVEAAEAAIEMILILERIKKGPDKALKSVGFGN